MVSVKKSGFPAGKSSGSLHVNRFLVTWFFDFGWLMWLQVGPALLLTIVLWKSPVSKSSFKSFIIYSFNTIEQNILICWKNGQVGQTQL